MGLDISHGCWDGAYGAFGRWRQKVAELAGLPPLELMEGFYAEDYSGPFSLVDCIKMPTAHDQIKRVMEKLPIKWECIRYTPLLILLRHSDCEGRIRWAECMEIAKALEKILPLFPDEDAGGHIGNWRLKTQRFINGLKLAYDKKEDVHFG